MIRFGLVTQEHSMGCAVACVASLCGISYSSALKLFDDTHLAWTRGFYCNEIVQALQKENLNFIYKKLVASDFYFELHIAGTIVFIAPNEHYPSGHFLLKTEKGWMNPWSNFPSMNPPQSKFEEKLPGEAEYVIFRQK